MTSEMMATDAGGTVTEIDGRAVRAAIEAAFENEWTDGMPVVPVTASILEEFLAATDRDPAEVLFRIPHLNRELTVELAALNAALAGCKPEYVPAVIAAWESIAKEPHPVRGIWQSTTGTAPFLLVNGPVRTELGVNCAGNVFGSGFRANATIGRAIRLALNNVFGLRPHLLDQATQGTPARYAAVIGEYEELSPWEPFHVEHGFGADESVVTAFVIRSVVHIEARHAMTPEQLAEDLIDTIARTGALIHEYTSTLLVLTPEHAALFADAGWSKAQLRDYITTNAVLDRADLERVGKDALATKSRWRLPRAHPDATADSAASSDEPDRVPVLRFPSSVQIVVAGANNAGVSAVVEVFTLNPPREEPYSATAIRA
ncbi:hypothetical protein GCM10011490_08950 [Pseudoclavibacter endophyticus]|uniref:Thioredoxin n=1 Tax=Pseudoclavibacter endophyticus TaxID=1778590 RepID=A0A6H9WFG4_9MICO|nr:hypothetical protein [Pseudoclavibacter endophyticus]KAB1649642.1 hypothetical protein F8O04_05205 [Pseudoclavibacter endophyticus]GGA60990.1 hypothetical protein GCM10011490_08950 [Pseudoclavibacter endophyticus]